HLYFSPESISPARGDALAVGGEGHAVDFAGGPLKGECLLSGVRVPHPHCSVLPRRVPPARCGDAHAVRGERHARDRAGVPLKQEDLLPRLRVPHSHRLVIAPRHDAGTIVGKRYTVDLVSVARKEERLLPGVRVPYLHLAPSLFGLLVIAS